ncbi:complement C1q-like protein 4 [Micropterus dolomieu]|uniref:complement C1q-like protein 4 n=1 Tax=Micropterus dolomieu TaxID=147949 RepID=UPI001E8D2CC9|nr:complement C1q-like protein 4 [Micropterus dolomieu]
MKIVTVIVPLLLLVCKTKAGNVPAYTCLQDVGAALKELTASLAQHAVEIRSLKKENKAQAAKVEQLGKQKTDVDKLKQQLQVKQVAFSASLLASGAATVGPFPGFTTMVFKNVVTNIGNAYNPNTGMFTPPVKGAYHFQFYIGAFIGSHGTAAVLVKNKERTFATYEHQTSGFGTATNGITLLLDVGDVVFMQLWFNSVVYDNENRHTTFSGHLLFTM